MQTTPLENHAELEGYLLAYAPLVQLMLRQYGIDVQQWSLQGDHLAVQARSAQEFDLFQQLLLQYADILREARLHDRRVTVFRFHGMLQTPRFSIPRIEVFEPKPEVDPKTLRPGIEHIAFTVPKYEALLADCRHRNVPIAKAMEREDGSKFFKTEFLNNCEIEFRNDELGERFA